MGGCSVPGAPASRSKGGGIPCPASLLLLGGVGGWWHPGVGAGCQIWGSWLEEGDLSGVPGRGAAPCPGSWKCGGARGQACPGSACSGQVAPWLLPAPAWAGEYWVGVSLFARRGAWVGSAWCLVSVSPLWMLSLLPVTPSSSVPSPPSSIADPAWSLPSLCLAHPAGHCHPLLWPGGTDPPCFPQQQ